MDDLEGATVHMVAAGFAHTLAVVSDADAGSRGVSAACPELEEYEVRRARRWVASAYIGR